MQQHQEENHVQILSSSCLAGPPPSKTSECGGHSDGTGLEQYEHREFERWTPAIEASKISVELQVLNITFRLGSGWQLSCVYHPQVCRFLLLKNHAMPCGWIGRVVEVL